MSRSQCFFVAFICLCLHAWWLKLVLELCRKKPSQSESHIAIDFSCDSKTWFRIYCIYSKLTIPVSFQYVFSQICVLFSLISAPSWVCGCRRCLLYFFSQLCLELLYLHQLPSLMFCLHVRSGKKTLVIYNNTKNYWKQKKRLCVRLRSGDKHHLRKTADRKAQISSVSGTNAFLICARDETGRFRDVMIKRCVATGDRTRVSGISLLRHNC